MRPPKWFYEVVRLAKEELGITVKIDLIIRNSSLLTDDKGRESAAMALDPTFLMKYSQYKDCGILINPKIIGIFTDNELIALLCHEVCHFKQIGHGKNFKKLLKRTLRLFGLKN